jgi:hypothetical protein
MASVMERELKTAAVTRKSAIRPPEIATTIQILNNFADKFVGGPHSEQEVPVNIHTCTSDTGPKTSETHIATLAAIC